MASSSGTSSGSGSGSGSGSPLLQNSGSEEDVQVLIDQRKRKRMISNRESARRSRMRKQKHLDDLMAQVAQLSKENQEIIANSDIITRHFANVEAENSILRVQVSELTHRLESLNEIISFLSGGGIRSGGEGGGFGSGSAGGGGGGGAAGAVGDEDGNIDHVVDSFFSPLACGFMNHPILASADTFQC